MIGRKIGFALAVVMTLFVGCPGGPDYLPMPRNLTLASDYDGLSIWLAWEPDTMELPDGYNIYFSGALIDSSLTGGYIHKKPARLGTYRVSGYMKDLESEKSNEVNNFTIDCDIIPVRDISSASPNGFGWTRDSGKATSHPMTDSANVTRVDFYITNFRSDTTSAPYYIASPSVTITDSTVHWPLIGTLHTNGFFGPLPFDLADADTVPGVGYKEFQRIEAGRVYGAYLQDGYFALVKIAELDTVQGRVMAQTVFQPVRNLRLFRR